MYQSTTTNNIKSHVYDKNITEFKPEDLRNIVSIIYVRLEASQRSSFNRSLAGSITRIFHFDILHFTIVLLDAVFHKSKPHYPL